MKKPNNNQFVSFTMAETEEPVVLEEETPEVEEVEVVEEEGEYQGNVDATEVKLFGKWEFKNIEVHDISLQVS